MVGDRREREQEREAQLCQLHAHEEAAPVDDVGEQSADRRQEQQRSELREEQQADVRRRAGQLVRIRTEHHVLHPRADVRRERAEVDDAEVAVPQRGLRGTPLEGDVAVDQRVFDLLACEGIQLGLLAFQHAGEDK